jgi:hypothetical protein
MGDRNTETIFVERPQRRDHLGYLDMGGGKILKFIFEKWFDVDWIQLPFVNRVTNEPSGSVKARKLSLTRNVAATFETRPCTMKVVN